MSFYNFKSSILSTTLNNKLTIFLIHSKYFPISDWSRPHVRCIVHYNQLLLTQFGKNFVILNWWRQNDIRSAFVPLQVIESLTENLRTRLCYIWWAEKQRAKWRDSVNIRGIFWMNNKAIIEFCFHRIWIFLQKVEGVIHLGLQSWWITPSLICRILHILLSLIQ